MAGNTTTPGASLVSRVLALLSCFDERHRSLSLTELAQRAHLPVSTTYRIASELAAGGVLTRGPSGQYVIGRRLWDIGLLAPVQTGLRQVASPFLTDLHAATRATVHLAIRDRAQVLYLERISGNASVPVVSTVGSRLPLHSTGVGKMLLAHAPVSIQEEALAALPRFTPFTITSPAQLRRQLERIHADGYATTTEEMTRGACSAAVPIRGVDGEQVVAALGVVVTSLRRDRARLMTALQVCAQGISRSLGTPR